MGVAGSRTGRSGPPRGRPRSEAVEQAIVEGVMKLLEDGVPLAGISVELIARTAGVGKATIYRRWSGKEELVAHALRSAEPVDPVLPGISLRDDLVVLLEALRRRGLATRQSALLHDVYAQMKTSPQIWAAYHATVIAPRRNLTLEVLRRGRDRGELPGNLDVDLLYDLFVGPMLVRSVLRPEAELPKALPELIVDTVLRGLSSAA